MPIFGLNISNFAPEVYYYRLDLALFSPIACHFGVDIANFVIVAHLVRLKISISVQVARHFRFTFAILDFLIFWSAAC